MAAREYMVEYNFDTDEGFFETPGEYEERVMVSVVSPTHPFLKKIGITQKIYDKISEIYNKEKTAIEEYKKKHGEDWWNASNGDDVEFTNGHDEILKETMGVIRPDAERSPSGFQKNTETVLYIVFLAIIDDNDFMKNFIKTKNESNQIYVQGMHNPIGAFLRLSNEADTVTEDPINSFILTYLLFLEYGHVALVNRSLNTKTIEINLVGILFKLISMYAKNLGTTN